MADKIKNVRKEIEEESQKLLEMLLPAKISVSEQEDRFLIEIEPKDPADASLLIGKFGTNLNSLQMILPQIIFKKTKTWPKISLEVEGYRKEREEKLIQKAREAADKARFLQKEVELEPLPPFERRIMHMALSEEKGVKTESRGEGRERRVVVLPSKG